jgi:uncharacterized protein with HEPN domain
MLHDSDKVRLGHMIEAAREALDHARNRTFSDLENNAPVRHLLVRNLEILGEAASRVSPELRDSYPEIPWRRIVNMRNRLIHAYFDIDMEIVWTTVQQFLPDVLEKLEGVLRRAQA